MSLVSEDQCGWLTCFPRVSGDEPSVIMAGIARAFVFPA